MCATKSPVPPGTSSMPAAGTAAPVDQPNVTAMTGAAGTAIPATAPAPAAHSGAAPSEPPAPATPAGAAGIEAIADSLSACADELHERIMRAIRQRPPGGAAGDPAGSPDGLADGIADAYADGHGDAGAGNRARGITQDAAQALFDQEVLLRQSANQLYVQAAVLAAAGMDNVRQDLLDVTAAARDTLRRVATVQALVALAAGLVSLAGAIAAGKPAQWPAAIKQVRGHLRALRDDGKTARQGDWQADGQA